MNFSESREVVLSPTSSNVGRVDNFIKEEEGDESDQEETKAAEAPQMPQSFS